MVSDFSIALAKFSAFTRRLPYSNAIRVVGEKSAEPRIVLYVADEAYDNGFHKDVVPEIFDNYPVTVEPQRNALKLLMAMWKYTDGNNDR